MTKKEEHTETSTNFDQYMLNIFVTVAVMVIGSAYFYSRVYKPFIRDNPDQFPFITPTKNPAHVSPSTSELVRKIPHFLGKYLIPGTPDPDDSSPIKNLAGEINAAYSESMTE